jgi:GNAT superfamily N-acetyltransferase
MLTIRPAEVGDVPAVLALIKELAAFEHLSDEVTATEEGLRRWLFGPDGAAAALIGEWDGRSVAYAVYFRNFSTFLAQPGLYLEDLFVSEPHRRRGIGTAMLRHLARMAADAGYGRLQWAALRWNANAIRLYERLGAVEEKEWAGYRLTGAALRQVAGRDT